MTKAPSQNTEHPNSLSLDKNEDSSQRFASRENILNETAFFPRPKRFFNALVAALFFLQLLELSIP